MKKQFFLIFLAGILITSCKQAEQRDFVASSMDLAAHQLSAAIAHIPDSFTNYGPRTIINGNVHYITFLLDWTVGFFPGSLWHMYEYTQDNKWKERAERFTNAIENAKFNTRHHDVGFVIYCSFGKGYRLTRNEHYRDVVIQAAHSLSTRFNPNVGAIKSWNTATGWQSTRGWEYPVIVDNMMNLELLFNAAKFTGDSSFYKIAVAHADNTLQNHYRPDYSSYHVIDFDSISGEVRHRHTAQGSAHESAWARGQAWGFYGFVMCYRETGYQRYLEQAEKIANWWMTHNNLPENLVPYWDFDAPNIPNEPRDASAAAITASALLELASFGTARSKEYFDFAEKTLISLSSPDFLAEPDENGFFILKHSVGSIPHNQEIDVPLNYADYYFLEGLIRYKTISPRFAP